MKNGKLIFGLIVYAVCLLAAVAWYAELPDSEVVPRDRAIDDLIAGRNISLMYSYGEFTVEKKNLTVVSCTGGADFINRIGNNDVWVNLEAKPDGWQTGYWLREIYYQRRNAEIIEYVREEHIKKPNFLYVLASLSPERITIKKDSETMLLLIVVLVLWLWLAVLVIYNRMLPIWAFLRPFFRRIIFSLKKKTK